MKQQRSTAILCAVILALLIFASPTALAASKEDHVSSFSTSDSVNYVYIPADTVLHVEYCTRLDSGKTLYFFGGGTLLWDPSYSDEMFELSSYSTDSPATLILDGVTLDGGGSDHGCSLIVGSMESCCRVILKNGACLQNYLGPYNAIDSCSLYLENSTLSGNVSTSFYSPTDGPVYISGNSTVSGNKYSSSYAIGLDGTVYVTGPLTGGSIDISTLSNITGAQGYQITADDVNVFQLKLYSGTISYDNSQHAFVSGSGAAPTKWSDHAAASYAGGSGSKDDPYLVSTAAQLARLINRTAVSVAYVKLTGDIDLSGHLWTPAKGDNLHLDGGGYTISNLEMAVRDQAYTGLFAQVSEVSNLTVSGTIKAVSTSTAMYAGAVAGRLSGGTVDNCTGKVEIKVYQTGRSNVYAGGLVGTSDGYTTDSVTNCTLDSAGSVQVISSPLSTYGQGSNSYTTAAAGGIVGYYVEEVDGCRQLGSVSVDALSDYTTVYTAGISATFSGARNCVAEGDVSASTAGYNNQVYMGGLCADAYYEASNSIAKNDLVLTELAGKSRYGEPPYIESYYECDYRDLFQYRWSPGYYIYGAGHAYTNSSYNGGALANCVSGGTVRTNLLHTYSSCTTAVANGGTNYDLSTSTPAALANTLNSWIEVQGENSIRYLTWSVSGDDLILSESYTPRDPYEEPAENWADLQSLINAAAAGSGSAFTPIYLSPDFSTKNDTSDQPITIHGKYIQLLTKVSDGGSEKAAVLRPANVTGHMFSIANGGLKLTNLTVDGCAEATTTTGSILYAENSTLMIGADSTLEGGVTSGNGGAIHTKNSDVSLSSSITNCSAALGGAVYADGGSVQIRGSITNCAANAGGAVYVNDGSTQIYSTISNCTADEGGGIYSTYYGSVTVSNTGSVSNCSAATGNGGGIYSLGSVSVNGSITNCSAPNGSGGGIGSTSGSATVTLAGTISGCSAGKMGGGIYGRDLTVNAGGSITGCSAPAGGGVYGWDVTLSGGSISGNTAGLGGGLYLCANSSNSLIWESGLLEDNHITGSTQRDDLCYAGSSAQGLWLVYNRPPAAQDSCYVTFVMDEEENRYCVFSHQTEGANLWQSKFISTEGYPITCTDIFLSVQCTPCTATLDANGGAFPDESTTKAVTAGYAWTVSNMPEAPQRADYAFTGWNTAADGSGSAWSSTSPYPLQTPGQTYYAQWQSTHIHQPQWTEQPPTCTQSGYEGCWYCESCGKYFSDENCENQLANGPTPLPASGHSWNDWIQISAPTYVDDGLEKRSCKSCGHEEERSLPATGAAEAANIEISFGYNKLTVHSIPPCVKVVFACYSSGKLADLQIFENTDRYVDYSFPLSAVEGVNEIKLFFLDSLWRPIAAARPLDM